QEQLGPGLSLRIGLGKGREKTDTPHPLGLLRARRQRPRRRAAEERYELPPPHSMTSSGWARSVGGTVRPSTFAVLRLIISSNLVGCSTGISPGLDPFKILST